MYRSEKTMNKNKQYEQNPAEFFLSVLRFISTENRRERFFSSSAQQTLFCKHVHSAEEFRERHSVNF